MAITYLKRIDNGASNNLVQVNTSDSTATATASNYITAQLANITAANDGAWTWLPGDLVLLEASDGVSWAAINSTFTTLTALGSLSPAVFSVATSSATPGTIRAITGKVTETATVMTSGNLVGVRGEVDYVGASGGFIYGVQGKVLPSGTLSGSEWSAGVFGQLDIHAATINGGQIAPIWGDYGTTSGTLTDQTGCYGIAMTNTTAVVTKGQIYLYGGATNLLYLNTNAGLSGTTYFQAAGTGATSWGYSMYAAATYVLEISVNGTTYYLPLKGSNA